MEQRYTYRDPQFLNQLVNIIAEEDCELTAVLHPDIPAFLDTVQRQSGSNYTLYDRESQYRIAQSKKGDIAAMVEACKAHNIIPYWSLVFSSQQPRIEYRGPWFGSVTNHEPQSTMRKPQQFLDIDKWYAIEFSTIANEHIADAKQAIAGFVERGYIVTMLAGRLEPRSGTSDHYYDWSSEKASFYAEDGEISFQGDPDLPQRIMRLPGFENALEGIGVLARR